MSSPLLEVKGIDVHYGPVQALKKVSLHINQGETVSLIGSNGAGKSTLLMSIFGQPRASLGPVSGRSSIAAPTSPTSRRTTSPQTALPSRLRVAGSFPT